MEIGGNLTFAVTTVIEAAEPLCSNDLAVFQCSRKLLQIQAFSWPENFFMFPNLTSPLSRTPQVNKALDFAYWHRQGLLSLVATYRLLRVA